MIKLMELKLEGIKKIEKTRSEIVELFKKIFTALKSTQIDFNNDVYIDINNIKIKISKIYYEELGDEIFIIDSDYNLQKIEVLDLNNLIKLFNITCSIEEGEDGYL